MDDKELIEITLTPEERVEKSIREGDLSEALRLCGGLSSSYDSILKRLRSNVETAASFIEKTLEESQRELGEKIEEALKSGEKKKAVELLREKRRQYLMFHDMFIRFMSDWYSCTLKASGEEKLEELFRYHADISRKKFEAEEALSTEDHVRWSARVLVNHGTKFQIIESEDKFTFIQDPCGTGGKLLNEQGGLAPAEISNPSPMTWGKAGLSSYCAHCAMGRGIASLEWFGRPLWVHEPPQTPEDPCVFHIYKNREDIPAEYCEKLRMSKQYTSNQGGKKK